MKTKPLSRVALAGVLCGLLTACHDRPIPDVPLTPVMAAPPARPVAVRNDPEAAAPVETAGGRPVATPDVASSASVAATGAVPGVPDPWNEIRDYPFERRDDFDARADTFIAQFNSAVNIVRLGQPKPGEEAQHTAALKQLEDASTALSDARANLTTANAPGWEERKNHFHDVMENAQAAYNRVHDTGT